MEGGRNRVVVSSWWMAVLRVICFGSGVVKGEEFHDIGEEGSVMVVEGVLVEEPVVTVVGEEGRRDYCARRQMEGDHRGAVRVPWGRGRDQGGVWGRLADGVSVRVNFGIIDDALPPSGAAWGFC